MQRRIVMLFVLMAALAGPAHAQTKSATPRATKLRAAIEERFTQRVVDELGLNAQQTKQLKDANARYAVTHAELDRREQAIRATLQRELRPGVPANQDSVAQALDGLAQVQLDRAQAFQSELKDLSAFLTPVQQAQFLILRDRLQQRVQDVRSRRSSARGRSSPS